MKFNSIITNIKIGFILTFVLFVLVFVAYLQNSQMEYMKQTANYYDTIQKHLHSKRANKNEVIDYVQSLNFELVRDSKDVLENAVHKFGGRGFEVVNYKGSIYFHINTPFFRILFKDQNSYEKNYFGHLLFAVLFVSFVFIYFWIMRALSPLKSLKKEIQKFANGELDINCVSDKKDEIAELGNEFDKAVKKIALLLNSRQLFLRTIMHELKTPIAKGRIVSELIDDEKQKERIIAIFEKLNHQINDFAKIEEIVSNNYTPNMYRSKVDSILNKSIDMLLLDTRENIFIQKDADKTITVDIDLLALAIKNLIDNALKYSSDQKVTIGIYEDRLDFISSGEALVKPLEEYYKPFHNDTKNKNHGMGLGLYIVHSILDMHKMSLEYKHEKNQNVFSIVYFH